MEYITSRNNDRIKKAVKLCTSSKFRKEQGLYFLEGARLCSDAAQNTEIAEAFFTENALEKYSTEAKIIINKSVDSFIITREVAEKMSDTKFSQGIFCICRMKNNSAELELNKKYIALENVQDPSNLGAVARTCEALGIDTIIINKGCDIYNPKAQRSAMGSLQRLKIITVDSMTECIEKANSMGIVTVAAVLNNCNCEMNILKSDSIICIIGNEGNGITEETSNLSKYRLTIPMRGRAESLNAASAATILIWELTNLQVE